MRSYSEAHDFERMASVCRSKASFPSASRAKQSAKRIKSAFACNMKPYHCPVCRCWHLGTKSKQIECRAQKAQKGKHAARKDIPR